MNKILKILHLEDSLKDSELIHSIIASGGIDHEYFLAENGKDYMDFLESQAIDLILSDYSLPDYNGIEALKVAREKYSYIPFVFVTGAMGEDAAINAMLHGASDYVLKSKLERLVPAISRALHEYELERELAFQNEEKDKRTAELIIINEELKKEKEKFRLVVESVPTAMVLTNQEDFIIHVNNQTEKLFGYERNELVGNKFEILIPERFRSQHPVHEELFLRKQQTRSIGAGPDMFAMRKDGSEIQVEISLNPIETIEGPMMLVSIIDLTERKLQEATLIKQMELEIKNKELEQFAYIASHDLQEPLRTVSNYMQIFEEDYLKLLDDNARHYLRSVNSATKRMSILIKALLDYSRLGHNATLTYVDSKKLVEEVLADLEALIKSTNTTIKVADLPKLNVYETELREVFQNLITNAIKFHKKDAHINIQINSEKINEKWQFSVSDNGIGIAPENFERIFDLFQRLRALEGEEFEGNGIGLANCKKIIQMHQGDIWVESTLGQGTTFYFTIPTLAE